MWQKIGFFRSIEAIAGLFNEIEREIRPAASVPHRLNSTVQQPGSAQQVVMDFPLDLSLLRWEDDTITTYSALPTAVCRTGSERICENLRNLRNLRKKSLCLRCPHIITI